MPIGTRYGIASAGLYGFRDLRLDQLLRRVMLVLGAKCPLWNSFGDLEPPRATQEVMVGMHGPVPKRADERRRRNKVDTTQVEVVGEVEAPPAVRGWHALAKKWYESLTTSGQAKFYEPSDWAVAQLIAESISRDLKPQFVGISESTGEALYEAIPMKGASLAAYLKAMSALMVTEGDRRRAQLEITRRAAAPVEAPAGVTRLDDYRDL